MKKKSQIKFGETFGIIIIVYLILMVGLVWYSNVNSKSIQKLENENFLNSAYTTYNFLINLDLIYVSNRGILKSTFDYHGIKALKELIENGDAPEIERQLQNSNIEIHLFEKEPGNPKLKQIGNITLFNGISPDTPPRLTQSYKLLIPVEDTIVNKNYIGIISLKISRR